MLRFGGRTHVTDTTVHSVTPSRSLSFDGAGTGGQVRGRRSVEPVPEGARLSTELHVETHGVMRLLEPLLATGDKPGAPVLFDVTTAKPGSDGRRVRSSYHRLTITGPQQATTPFAPSERPPGTAEAVLINTDLGPLLIAVWYGESAQFCPGPMAKHDMKIVVPGVAETSAAWLLTPTSIRHLPDRPVAGGKEITIEKFDQTAAVLFTTDQSVIGRFDRAISRLAPEAARAAVELARLKRQRVANTHRQLSAVAQALPDGPAMLQSADEHLALAENLLEGIAIRTGMPQRELDPSALAVLASYRWPGNVRELRNVLEQAAMLTDSARLTAEDFAAILPASAAREARVGGMRPLPEQIAELERSSIRLALAATGGNKVSAARMLGISRATLYEKLSGMRT